MSLDKKCSSGIEMYTRLNMLFIPTLSLKAEFSAMLNNAKNAEQRWECLAMLNHANVKASTTKATNMV